MNALVEKFQNLPRILQNGVAIFTGLCLALVFLFFAGNGQYLTNDIINRPGELKRSVNSDVTYWVQTGNKISLVADKNFESISGFDFILSYNEETIPDIGSLKTIGNNSFATKSGSIQITVFQIDRVDENAELFSVTFSGDANLVGMTKSKVISSGGADNLIVNIQRDLGNKHYTR